MRIRLTPRDHSFYELFTEAAKNNLVGSRLLVELFNDGADRAAIADKMRECEHAGDDCVHRVMQRMNQTFVTPFDRQDIYRLASEMDDVMDYMEAAADLVVLYQLDELPREMIKQVEVLERAAELTAEAMPRLKAMRDLQEYWIEINRLENQGDQIYRKLLAHLFGGTYDALTVMKLKEIVDQLEQAMDSFEHVANTVETIAVKES
ncbi:MAG: DUF47 family protein [Streptosporangiales bacterium]|nr:DUF47 family protein [Streptosporangiales bacterium]